MNSKSILKTAAALLLITISFSACDPDTDPKPLSPASRAALGINNNLSDLRYELSLYRDTSHSVSEKIAIETEMTVLITGTKFILSEIYLKPQSELANLARFEAVEDEIKLAISDSALATLPSELAQSTKTKAESILELLSEAKSLSQAPTLTSYKLSNDWIKFLESETKNASVGLQFFDALLDVSLACIIGTPDESLVAPLLQMQRLHRDYSLLIKDALVDDSVSYNWFAKLKISAIRMAAMTQLFSEWANLSPLTNCNYSPEILDVMDGGPGSGKSCMKMSHGNEPGTAGGVATGNTSGSGSTGFPITTSSTVNTGPGSSQTITPCTVEGGGTDKVPAPSPQ